MLTAAPVTPAATAPAHRPAPRQRARRRPRSANSNRSHRRSSARSAACAWAGAVVYSLLSTARHRDGRRLGRYSAAQVIARHDRAPLDAGAKSSRMRFPEEVPPSRGDVIDGRKWTRIDAKPRFAARDARSPARGAEAGGFRPRRSRRWRCVRRPAAAPYRGGDLRQSRGRHRAHAGPPIGRIDLPLKTLVWEAVDGKVWLAYNDPAWIALRHGLGPASAAAAKAVTAMLVAVAQEATK